MPEICYVGIDPGVNCGVAAVYRGSAVTGVFNVNQPHKGWRFDQIKEAILEVTYMVVHDQPVPLLFAAGIEKVPNVNNQNVYAKLQQISRDIEIALGKLDIWDMHWYSPASWKKVAFGAGNAPKGEHGERLCDTLKAKVLPIEPKQKRQDAYDALALAVARRNDMEVQDG